jgi:hypothetical protein
VLTLPKKIGHKKGFSICNDVDAGIKNNVSRIATRKSNQGK